jgi:hypothetical protein
VNHKTRPKPLTSSEASDPPRKKTGYWFLQSLAKASENKTTNFMARTNFQTSTRTAGKRAASREP